MAFSGAVRIGDLNDFIAPSQACVVSLQGSKVSLSAEDAQVGPRASDLHGNRMLRSCMRDGSIESSCFIDCGTCAVRAVVASCGVRPSHIHAWALMQHLSPLYTPVTLRPNATAHPLPAASGSPQADMQVQLHSRRTNPPAGGGFKQTYTEGDGGPIKVSLHDCLACSGCVTSAETVLLQHQSRQEFEAKLREPGAVVVVSISPQSRTSLAGRLHGWMPFPCGMWEPFAVSILDRREQPRGTWQLAQPHDDQLAQPLTRVYMGDWWHCLPCNNVDTVCPTP